MVILQQDGSISFDNIKLYKGISIDCLLEEVANTQIELWESNAGFEMYRFKRATIGKHGFILMLLFQERRLCRISISVDGPELSWDDVTPKSIERDRAVLCKLVLCNSMGDKSKRVYSWGKVELWRDIKNSADYNVTVAYS